MRNLLKIALLTGVIGFTACESNLEFSDYNKLPQEEFWQTKEDAISALTACYGQFNADWAYYDNSVMGPEEMAGDNTAKGSTAGSQSEVNAFIDYSFTPSFTRFDNLWKSRYAMVNLCNQVLEYVPDIEMDEADKKQILGEAKFIRAWTYFEMAKLWGEVIIYDGLPENGAYDIEKSSIEEVYAFILRDLKYGYENMRKSPWGSEWKGRVTAWSARALEAKVLMYMASGVNFMPDGQAIGEKTWEDVKTVTNDVINNGIYSLYTAKGDSSFFYLFRLAQENCDESIFESQAGVSSTNGGVAQSAYALNSWVKSFDGGFGYSVPSDDLVAAWKAREAEQNDLRYQYSVIFYGDTLVDDRVVEGATDIDGVTGLPRYNYKVYIPLAERSDIKGNWWMQQTEQNQRFFRFADVLLIDAEAKFMTNDVAGAAVSLNKVRSRAGEPEISSGNLTLQDIWDERRFELAFENDRYFDLVRTGQAETVLGSRGWTKPKNVFYPIPQVQIDLSIGPLKQNAYWE
ncbi:RagB/SusD family nutrient uptake outer membrane protein [Sunxiuqinia rutila]|uniref:RagB/SusD family nutrient uptake outer membrane protein n=1 Tax=Sunxiuqinia rutila TaxID=1397841 RepID=UPI003D364BC3